MAHEWLADLIFYLIFSICGEIGIFVLSLFGAFAIVYLLWREVRQYFERNVIITGIYFILLGTVTYGFFYGRPHLFSIFFVYLELKIIFKFYDNPNSKIIYWLPLLSCVWGNIHGGYASLSYVLCIVFLFASIFNIPIGRITPNKLDKKAIFKLLFVSISSFAALSINPIGLDVLLYPYKSFGDPLQMSFINEWHSPDVKSLFNLIFYFFPIVLMMIGFFAEKDRIRLIDLLIMGLFIFLFLRSVRFIILWYIAAAFCGFQYMPELKIKSICPKFTGIFTVVIAIVFLFLIGDGCSNIVKTVQSNNLISVTLSDDAIYAVKENEAERVFNDYNYGEALIYNDIPVFFDARADLYVDNGMLADGISLLTLKNIEPDTSNSFVDVNGLLDKYDFDSILIQKSRPLYAYLISHPEQFICVFEDNSTGYFKILE